MGKAKELEDRPQNSVTKVGEVLRIVPRHVQPDSLMSYYLSMNYEAICVLFGEYDMPRENRLLRDEDMQSFSEEMRYLGITI